MAKIKEYMKIWVFHKLILNRLYEYLLNPYTNRLIILMLKNAALLVVMYYRMPNINTEMACTTNDAISIDFLPVF